MLHSDIIYIQCISNGNKYYILIGHSNGEIVVWGEINIIIYTFGKV